MSKRERKQTNYCEISSGDEQPADESEFDESDDEDAPLGQPAKKPRTATLESSSDDDQPLGVLQSSVPVVKPSPAASAGAGSASAASPKRKLSFAMGDNVIEFTDSDEPEPEPELEEPELEEPEQAAPSKPTAKSAKVSRTGAAGPTFFQVPGGGALPLMLAASALGKSGGALLLQGGRKRIEVKGDAGAIGRIEADKRDGLRLDLKGSSAGGGGSQAGAGTKYEGTVYGCSTLCVLNVGASEAKIESVLHSFVQLTPLADTVNTEKMLEGDLKDYACDLDDGGTKGMPEPEEPPKRGKKAGQGTIGSYFKKEE